MMSSMIFSSKVMLVVIVVRRAPAPADHHETDAERDRRQAARRASASSAASNQLASVLRIALFLSISERRRQSSGVLLPVRIGRDQGAFAAGTPRKESYNRAATPATMATSARLNTYQL